MAKKVLIVEDNELNMKLFHDLLDAQGYETLQTREGLQALAPRARTATASRASSSYVSTSANTRTFDTRQWTSSAWNSPCRSCF